MENKTVKAIKKPIQVTARQAKKKEIIQTIEGPLAAQRGDWIVIGVEGEMYPVKKEIFEKTYIIIEK